MQPPETGLHRRAIAYIATPYFPASNGKWSFHDYDMVYVVYLYRNHITVHFPSYFFYCVNDMVYMIWVFP
jgi:hypothetical protein